MKATTELFNELSVIGAPMEEEDEVVTLLASLPNSFNMLVTALEANAEVPSMEVVTERLLHEERKSNERETASSEKAMLGKKGTTVELLHYCLVESTRNANFGMCCLFQNKATTYSMSQKLLQLATRSALRTCLQY